MQKALEGFAEVTGVMFNPALEKYEVTYLADAPRGEEFRRAVQDLIIFPGTRKFLGGIGDQLHNSPEGRP